MSELGKIQNPGRRAIARQTRGAFLPHGVSKEEQEKGTPADPPLTREQIHAYFDRTRDWRLPLRPKFRPLTDVAYWDDLGARLLADYVRDHAGCSWTDVGVAARKAKIHRKHMPDLMAFLEIHGRAHLTDAGWFPGRKSRG